MQPEVQEPQRHGRRLHLAQSEQDIAQLILLKIRLMYSWVLHGQVKNIIVLAALRIFGLLPTLFYPSDFEGCSRYSSHFHTMLKKNKYFRISLARSLKRGDDVADLSSRLIVSASFPLLPGDGSCGLAF